MHMKKLPVANDAVAAYVKNIVETTGKCPFKQSDEFLANYCWFVYDFGCKHYGKLIGMDQKREYRKCNL